MTQRTPYGYQHPNAYRTWEKEHDELLLAVAIKARDTTALQSTVSLETLAFCMGRSPQSLARRAAKLQVFDKGCLGRAAMLGWGPIQVSTEEKEQNNGPSK